MKDEAVNEVITEGEECLEAMGAGEVHKGEVDKGEAEFTVGEEVGLEDVKPTVELREVDAASIVADPDGVQKEAAAAVIVWQVVGNLLAAVLVVRVIEEVAAATGSRLPDTIPLKPPQPVEPRRPQKSCDVCSVPGGT